MKLFLTGGSGFIGSNFIRYMHQKYPNMDILNYDKLTYAGNSKNLENLLVEEKFMKHYTFIRGDICDEKVFSAAINDFKPDVVVAMAAESHVDRSITNPQQFLVTNVLGTEVVLRVCRDKKVPKLVHISTDEVYGSVIKGESSEEDAFKPNSPYSVSKASGDLLCRAFVETFKTPVVVARGSNCFGSFQHPEKFLPKSITNLIQGKPINLYGDGKQTREWIYVTDFCWGVEQLVFKGRIGEAYNLGSGHRASNIQICEMLLNIFTDIIGIEHNMDRISFVADRPGHDQRYALNSEKLGNQMNRGLTVDLQKGLRQTVEWYRINKDWWAPLI